MRETLTVTLTLTLTLTGCGAASSEVKASGPAWAVAGARCKDGQCECRALDGSRDAEEPPPPEGTKRFELRTGRGLDPADVLVDGRPAVKKRLDTPEPTCAYIDLAPGRHTVALRTTAKEAMQGFNPSLVIAEYGAAAGRYYDTFRFLCGGTAAATGEPCLRDDVRAQFEKYQAIPRGLHDPCGSTRIEQPRWGAERSPEAKLEDLQLDLTLHVYKFPPKLAPGSAECGKRHAKELEE